MSQLGLTNPVFPGEITQAGMLVAVGPAGTYYDVTAKPDTSALATGFRQAGVVADLPTIEAGIDTVPVPTGIYGLPAAFLFQGMKGSVALPMFGLDAGLLALGLGVTPVTSYNVSPSTTTASVVTLDSATGFSKVTVTSPTGITVGMMVVLDDTATIASSTNFAKVYSISGSDIVLDRVLRYNPASGQSFKSLKNVMLPIGGTLPKEFSLACLLDFPDGRVAMFNFPKVHTAKALSFGAGSGQDAVKLPVEFQAIGQLDVTYGVLIGKYFMWP